MKFQILSAQDVKSISQRGLLYYWNDLAKGRRYPAFSDFTHDGRRHDPQSLAIWGAERENGRLVFRAMYQGERLKQAFHDDWVGKAMEEVMPAPVRRYAVDLANECAASGNAVFSVFSTTDECGCRVDCERLLLPFGRGDVETIVASLQLISLKGAFERRTVLDRYGMASTVELAGCIRSGFAKPAIHRLADVPGEHIRSV